MKGFTLVEVIVSLAVLTVGLIPAFLGAANGVRLIGSIRNSLIAAHLAQEGVELVHGIRDDNWFAVRPFDSGLTNCSSGCRIQYDTDGQSKPPLSGNANPLKWDANTGLYQYDSGTDTPFTRTLTITSVSDHEIKVVSAVGWTEQTGPKTFSAEYYLFDWNQ